MSCRSACMVSSRPACVQVCPVHITIQGLCSMLDKRSSGWQEACPTPDLEELGVVLEAAVHQQPLAALVVLRDEQARQDGADVLELRVHPALLTRPGHDIHLHPVMVTSGRTLSATKGRDQSGLTGPAYFSLWLAVACSPAGLSMKHRSFEDSTYLPNPKSAQCLLLAARYKMLGARAKSPPCPCTR